MWYYLEGKLCKRSVFMAALQLELFLSEEECEIKCLRNELRDYKVTLDKLRKSSYARINALERGVIEVTARQDIIERNMCHN